MKRKMLLCLFVFPILLTAQPNNDDILRQLGIQMPQVPQPYTPPNYSNWGLSTPSPPNIGSLHTNPQIQAQQQSMMREVQMHQQRRAQQQAMLDEIYADADKIFNPKKVDLTSLPSLSYIPTTSHYRTAYLELEKMLKGEKELSLKEAVYIVENAFYENTLPSERLTTYVQNASQVIQIAMQQKGYAANDESAKKIFLHQFMTGKIQLFDKNGKIAYSSNPILYDFDDPIGRNDHRKMFVSKLIDEGKGQCHSMPLLYLMIAEELGIDAWLSTSPNHTFIKIQDEKGKWYNLELTNGHYVNNEFLMKSGYVSGESIRKGIYLDTLSKKEVIARCMADLADGYRHKFGYDKFVLETAETALKYYPKDLSAWSFKANYYGYWLMYVGNTLGYKSVEQIQQDFFANQILQERNRIYFYIDQAGYNPMSMDEYKKWLKSFNAKHQVKFPIP